MVVPDASQKLSPQRNRLSRHGSLRFGGARISQHPARNDRNALSLLPFATGGAPDLIGCIVTPRSSAGLAPLILNDETAKASRQNAWLNIHPQHNPIETPVSPQADRCESNR